MVIVALVALSSTQYDSSHFGGIRWDSWDSVSFFLFFFCRALCIYALNNSATNHVNSDYSLGKGAGPCYEKTRR